MEMNVSNPHHTSETGALMDAMQNLAKGEGVTLTPLPKVWMMKISRSLPYHRGRNAGMTLAVAASGKKNGLKWPSRQR